MDFLNCFWRIFKGQPKSFHGSNSSLQCLFGLCAGHRAVCMSSIPVDLYIFHCARNFEQSVVGQLVGSRQGGKHIYFLDFSEFHLAIP